MPVRSVIDHVNPICSGVSPHARRSRTGLKVASLKAIEVCERLDVCLHRRYIANLGHRQIEFRFSSTRDEDTR